MLNQKNNLVLYEVNAPKATAVLESGFDEVLDEICLPPKYQKRLRTTSSIEHLNEELCRR